jgi:hypothetical protein
VIIQLTGPPEFPVFAEVAVSDRRFAPTNKPAGTPSSETAVKCTTTVTRRFGAGVHRLTTCKRLPRRRGIPRGAVFAYGLNAPATVKIGVYSASSGATLAEFVSHAVAGENYLPFTGWVSGRALRPGSYEAEFVAKNETGTSRPATVRFTIVRVRAERGTRR